MYKIPLGKLPSWFSGKEDSLFASKEPPSEKSFWERTKETLAKASSSYADAEAKKEELARTAGRNIASSWMGKKKKASKPNYLLYGAIAGGALLLVMLARR